jgi:hypothetical protein
LSERVIICSNSDRVEPSRGASSRRRRRSSATRSIAFEMLAEKN